MGGVAPILVVIVLFVAVDGWNSIASYAHLYSFQEFYTDAQYGPDFGYYSTGRILHEDGPTDNGVPGKDSGQEWFNSYTTLPMMLSPHFGNSLCDRLVSMWQSMGRPAPFVLVEFGGGTGMLARDVLRRARDFHAEFFRAIVQYTIGERSPALRSAQLNTAAEFVASGKLVVMEADAGSPPSRRSTSRIREALQHLIGVDQPIRGAVISNELLDEFDPVRLRLYWQQGYPPNVNECVNCEHFREAYVLHTVNTSAIEALLRSTPTILGNPKRGLTEVMEEIIWDGNSALCGLLRSRGLAHAVASVAEQLGPAENALCAPSRVCCLPFVLAANQFLQYHHDAVGRQGIRRKREDGSFDLMRIYLHHLWRTNNTVPLAKNWYRVFRRAAASRGHDFEKSFLVSDVRSYEVFLRLSDSRCSEMKGWLKRNSARLASAAKLRDGSTALFDGNLMPPRTSVHLKLVARPGDAAFVENAAQIVDEGFLVTMDYGADADALAWQSILHPTYEGIHIIDARDENLDHCTSVSYLECPGLQDLTTSVDFTEVATAGQELGGWSVLAYGPILLLELGPRVYPLEVEYFAAAFGARSANTAVWYQAHGSDPWASFKILVQHRGLLGYDWSMGHVGKVWPLQRDPRLFRSPSPCWSRDITKPPLASLITTAAHNHVGNLAWGLYSENAALASSPLVAASLSGSGTSKVTAGEPAYIIDTLLAQFWSLVGSGGKTLDDLLSMEHVFQRKAYEHMHLALLMADYWRLANNSQDVLLHQFTHNWHFDEIFGESVFHNVFKDISRYFVANRSLEGTNELPPYLCLAVHFLRGNCCGAPVADFKT